MVCPVAAVRQGRAARDPQIWTVGGLLAIPVWGVQGRLLGVPEVARFCRRAGEVAWSAQRRGRCPQFVQGRQGVLRELVLGVTVAFRPLGVAPLEREDTQLAREMRGRVAPRRSPRLAAGLASVARPPAARAYRGSAERRYFS